MKAKESKSQECVEDLAVYLSEVYALERRTESIWADRIGKIPAAHANIADYLKEHIRQKKLHIMALKNCLQKLAVADPGRDYQSSPHYIADIGLQLAADNLEAEAFCNTAFERFEAAIYRKIIDLATEAGHEDIADVCQAILKQEESVAQWLEHALHEAPLSNANTETAPETDLGEGSFIDARLMQLRHPESAPTDNGKK